MDRPTIRHDPPVNQDSTGDVRENEASPAAQRRGSRKRLGNGLVHVTGCFWQRTGRSREFHNTLTVHRYV